jgi:hypothetical protein
MVIHLREYQSPTGILCGQQPAADDTRALGPEGVDCPRCLEIINLARERYRRSLPQISGPVSAGPRTDVQLLDLLAKAHAQGVHRLEVHSDGSFTAEITPPPPPPAPEPKPLTRAEQEAADEAALLGRVLR